MEYSACCTTYSRGTNQRYHFTGIGIVQIWSSNLISLSIRCNQNMHFSYLASYGSCRIWGRWRYPFPSFIEFAWVTHDALSQRSRICYSCFCEELSRSLEICSTDSIRRIFHPNSRGRQMLVRTLSYYYEIYINQTKLPHCLLNDHNPLYYIIGVPNANTWMGPAWLHLGG